MKPIKHLYLTLFACLLSLIFAVSATHAAPLLQLGIGDASYDAADKTIVSSERNFNLYAYGRAEGNKVVDTQESHFLSVALIGSHGPVNEDFGSFTINNVSFSASELVFGNPPFEESETAQGFDKKDLKPHGSYSTLFTEIEFLFTTGMTTKNVNTRNKPGYMPQNNGTKYFYQDFAVITADLKQGYNLHFDLYTKNYRNNGDIDIKRFAPFTHDAGTRYAAVPEPAPFILLAMGLCSFIVRRQFHVLKPVTNSGSRNHEKEI